MKTALRIVIFLVMLAATIFGARFIIKELGPEDWQARIKNQKLSTEKRVKSIKKNIERILKLHNSHIATINSLRKSYKQIAEVHKDKIKNLKALSKTQNRIGNQYLKSKYIRQALKYYNLALELYEFDIEALVNKGICYYNLGLYQNDPIEQYKEFLQAEKFYKKALHIASRKLSPTDKKWRKQSLLYLSLLYRTIKEKNIDRVNAKFNKKGAKRDFLELAIKYSKQLYKIDPEHTQNLFQLGALSYMKNELSRAKNYYLIILSSQRPNRRQKEKARKFINRIDMEIRNPGLNR